MAEQEFPGGERLPAAVSVNKKTARSRIPIANWQDIFAIKLNSVRDRDLFDLVSLCRSMGRVPKEQELGTLNLLQQENLDAVKSWVNLRLDKPEMA